jgi:hypothetical protein
MMDYLTYFAFGVPFLLVLLCNKKRLTLLRLMVRRAFRKKGVVGKTPPPCSYQSDDEEAFQADIMKQD